MISETDKEKEGYVYILSNPAMPGILKIGCSKIGGRSRASDLYHNGGTGVPMPYVFEFEIWSKDCSFKESIIHKNLAEHRINKSREFFKISVEEATKELIRSICMDYDLTAINYEYEMHLYEQLESNKQEILKLRIELLKLKSVLKNANKSLEIA